MESDLAGKTCFIITPIGSSESSIFRHINGVIKNVIRPILLENEFADIKAAHEISEPGSINTQLINRIVHDDLVIANLTGNNPNVMYELCLRHVVAKPIIHICEYGTTLPFDIKDNRTIFYRNDMLGAEELKENLREVMGVLNYKKEYKDNPIYNAIKIKRLLDIDTETSGTPEMDILKQILQYMTHESMNSVNEKEVNLTSCVKVQFDAKDSMACDKFIESLEDNANVKVKIIDREIIKDKNTEYKRYVILVSYITGRDSEVIDHVIRVIAEEGNIKINFIRPMRR